MTVSYCLRNGLIIATVTLQKHGNMILAGPDIVSRGFVYVRESESLMEGARDVARDAVEECLERNITDWAESRRRSKTSLVITFGRRQSVIQ